MMRQSLVVVRRRRRSILELTGSALDLLLVIGHRFPQLRKRLVVVTAGR